MVKFRKENRATIYKGTVDDIKQGFYVDGSGNQHDLGLPGLLDGSRYFQKVRRIENVSGNGLGLYPRIYTQLIDCVQKAYEFGPDGALLNMASRVRAGGGVFNGAGSQEEEIFRRTTLGYSLYWFDENAQDVYDYPKKYHGLTVYPIRGDRAAIWSPGVTIFRSGASGYYDHLQCPGVTNVISVPAVKNPEISENGEFKEAHGRMWRNKIRTVLRVAILGGKTKLVLGAFGCGAYGNPPELVAKLFKEILGEPEFQGYFSQICFAILEDQNSPKGGNYAPFDRVFGHSR